MKNSITTVVSIFVCGLLLLPTQTQACSYIWPEEGERYETLDQVFIGELVDYDIQTKDSVVYGYKETKATETLTLRVVKPYKGDIEVGDELTYTQISNLEGGDSCSISPLFYNSTPVDGETYYFSVEAFAGDTQVDSDGPEDTTIFRLNEFADYEKTLTEHIADYDARYSDYYEVESGLPEQVAANEGSSSANATDEEQRISLLKRLVALLLELIQRQSGS